MKNIDDIWEQLLSRDAKSIRALFSTLSADEKLATQVHLKKMAYETGWHPEQKKSALKAFLVIEEIKRK